jgi:chromate reductase
MTKIGFIVGSLREGSYNKITAKTFAELLPPNYEAVWIEIGDLPFYNEDLDVDGKTPEQWRVFREKIATCQGFFFFTPEYNRSVPAVLKNAIDVGSRPYGANAWDTKPALVVSVSIGAISGFGANHHLRQALAFVNMPTLQQPEAYVGNVTSLLDNNGEYITSTKDFFQLIVDKYVDFFERLTK